MDKNISVFGHDISIKPSQETMLAGMPIGKEQVKKAGDTLKKYMDGKASLDTRIIENEEWYRLQHWEYIRSKAQSANAAEKRPEPASAWMFNSLANKHADIMDNFPEPNVLPRAKDDEDEAKKLSSILPVVFERNHFEETYSKAAWTKLKSGTAAFGVFWDKSLENGLGDISITEISMLNLFWEPGINDLQKSRNLFVVSLEDIDILESDYPDLRGKQLSSILDVKKFAHDDNIDTTSKAAVVDWYYHTKVNGKRVLHFAKFVGDNLLFSSENDPASYPNGWYAHGRYPIELDVLFPIADSPAGFGIVDICKNPQMYIDKLDQAILENAAIGAKPRFLRNRQSSMNVDDVVDWSKSFIDVDGPVDERNLTPVQHPTLDPIYVKIRDAKVEELKDTSANRDFNAGSSSGGVTAASAIAALQESGNKQSRDMISASYRTYAEICTLSIELDREFYDEARSFRITGEAGAEYIDYSNAGIKPQQVDSLAEGAEPYYRLPVFDVKIKPQKRNPFSRNVQNQMAMEFFGAGFFNPQRAPEALIALEMLDFEGKDKIKTLIQQGQTLQNIILQQQAIISQFAALTGLGQQQPQGGTQGQPAPKSGGNDLASALARAQTPDMTPQGKKYAARAKAGAS